MLFRNQRNMTVTFGREGWLRPGTPLPSGDTVMSGCRQDLQGVPLRTRGRLPIQA